MEPAVLDLFESTSLSVNVNNCWGCCVVMVVLRLRERALVSGWWGKGWDGEG
jgi:hypothetical protein